MYHIGYPEWYSILVSKDFLTQLSGITSESESIFKYDDGKSHADYSVPGFVPVFLDEFNATIVQNATQICGEGNLTCIFDYVLTGNTDLALSTRDSEKRTAIVSADIGTYSLSNCLLLLSITNYGTNL